MLHISTVGAMPTTGPWGKEMAFPCPTRLVTFFQRVSSKSWYQVRASHNSAIFESSLTNANTISWASLWGHTMLSAPRRTFSAFYKTRSCQPWHLSQNIPARSGDFKPVPDSVGSSVKSLINKYGEGEGREVVLKAQAHTQNKLRDSTYTAILLCEALHVLHILQLTGGCHRFQEKNWDSGPSSYPSASSWSNGSGKL